MDKVLVEVFLPAENAIYDVYFPLSSKMSDVLRVVSSLLSDLSGGSFLASEDTLLCDAVSGIIFNINLSINELGIKNGSKLMLI